MQDCELLLQELHVHRHPLVVPDLLRLEQPIVSSGFRHHWRYLCANGICSVFEYTYLLFWNSFWTILPVIAMGIFDRIVGEIIPSYILVSLSNIIFR